MPDPAPESMFDHIYVEEHPLVDAPSAASSSRTPPAFEGGH